MLAAAAAAASAAGALLSGPVDLDPHRRKLPQNVDSNDSAIAVTKEGGQATVETSISRSQL